MIKTGVKQMRQNLTKYLRQVQQGQEIIITKRDEPIAKLVPMPKKSLKQLGAHDDLRGVIQASGKTLSQVVTEMREERV